MRERGALPCLGAAAKLESLREEADRDKLVAELVDKHWPEDYAAAVIAVDSQEDPDYEATGEEDERIPPRFAHIDQDREEWQRQRNLPAEERTEDFAQMEKNIAEYGDAISEEMQRLEEPRRQALAELSVDELIAKIKPGRIEEAATEQYLHWHAAWTWMACTYRGCKAGTPRDRVWNDINTMKQQCPPEVVEALRTTFDTLDNSLTASRRGKGS